MRKKTLKNTIVACTLAGMITLAGTGSEAALGDRSLYQGVNHPDVKELQQSLKSLNFFNHGQTTTYYGNITKQAVIKFQKANGLSADGIFGPASVRALKGKSPSSARSQTQANKNNSSSTLAYKGSLRQGAKGSDVANLQNALKKLGHYNLPIDSSFGPGTRAAVISFQRAKKITVDGSAGPATLKAINNALNGNIKANSNTSTPNRANTSKNANINIVNTAKSHIGGRYVYGGTSPSGFDCSGFTQYVYKQMGINIPRTTTSQANAGSKVSKSQLRAGDLLIFSNTYRNGPSHAGVYIGNGQFVHAANPTSGVRVDSINSNYYSSKFSYGRRVY